MTLSEVSELEGLDLREAYRRLTGNASSTANHAYQLARDGRFPVKTYRVGRRVMVNRRDFERFLNGDNAEQAQVA